MVTAALCYHKSAVSPQEVRKFKKGEEIQPLLNGLKSYQLALLLISSYIFGSTLKRIMPPTATLLHILGCNGGGKVAHTLYIIPSAIWPEEPLCYKSGWSGGRINTLLFPEIDNALFLGPLNWPLKLETSVIFMLSTWIYTVAIAISYTNIFGGMLCT